MALMFETALTVAILAVAFFTDINTAPVSGGRLTWQNPCGDGTSIGDTELNPAWDNATPGDQSHSTHYKEVSDAAGRAKRSIEDLQNQFVLKGRITTRGIEQIKNIKLSHMPIAPALSQAKENAHRADSLKRARIALAEVSVFLKHMIEEEEDVFVGHTSASLLDEMKELEQKYLYGGVMCNVHHSMIATRVSHDFNFENEADIRDSIIDLLGDEAQRHVANYIILRDLGKLLDFIKLEFVELAKRYAA